MPLGTEGERCVAASTGDRELVRISGLVRLNGGASDATAAGRRKGRVGKGCGCHTIATTLRT